LCLNSGPCNCWVVAPLLELCTQLIFVFFSYKVLSFCQGLGSDWGYPIYASLVDGIIDVHHYPWLVGWDGVLLIFCLDWTWTWILPISDSGVTGITGMSHQA
jgi:hypothetical protein